MDPTGGVCFANAKECYGYEKDPAVCDRQVKECEAKFPPPPPADPVAECHAKAKECYGYAQDTAACDALAQRCEKLGESAAVDACSIEVKICFSLGGDPLSCAVVQTACSADTSSAGPE